MNKPQPFKEEIKEYDFHDVAEYINWIYFFHSWNFQPKFSTISQIHNCNSCRNLWLEKFNDKERIKAMAAINLYDDALQLIKKHNQEFKIKIIYQLYEANSDMDDIIIGDYRIPFLRQQKPESGTNYCLCLADFIRPIELNKADTLGVFAATIDKSIEKAYSNDQYNNLLMQTIAERMVEAATEKCHEYIRKTSWGYSPNENLTVNDLLLEKFDGIRPAIGYPSIPDHTINFILDELISFKRIGIKITENGAMSPISSISGFMFAHPKAKYFSIGKITEEQLEDYSKRRGLPKETIAKFLSKNIKR